jgi:hypothetical protein
MGGGDATSVHDEWYKNNNIVQEPAALREGSRVPPPKPG